MKYYFTTILLFLSTCITSFIFGQNISLFKQLNGKYNFVFIGNTLNPIENTFQTSPSIFTSSSANLDLNPNDVIEKAYLYWAGSGTGDFNVNLNGQNITPDRTFEFKTASLDYFSAFKDVTNQIKQTGIGNYTLSELDVSPFIGQHYLIKTNFAGWCIIIIYQNPSLTLNQLNIYDGFQIVPNEVNITLTNLNVIDNKNAKIGFLAWEGDSGLAENETLSINGNPISNPPLNPVNNAFNGTNSNTNSSTLYNMDLDVYSIENNISIGDTSAEIKLSSGRDVVLINAIVTQLNSQLPDATINIKNTELSCDSRTISVDYIVSNSNSTSILPINTSIAIYANNIFLKTVLTQSNLAIGAIEERQIAIEIPTTVPDNFELKFVVDDNGTGNGIVTEINESNNELQIAIVLKKTPQFNLLAVKETCNEGFNRGTFNLSEYEEIIITNPSDEIYFYETPENAQINTNAILNATSYQTTNSPKTIYTRIENEFCFSTSSFVIKTKNCLPIIYNYVSANNDGKNETFNIEGLKDIFLNYETSIFNRWGTLVWKGDKNTPEWNGFANKGVRVDTKGIPSGTYFYVINLNDPDYPESLTGYLYLTR
jgi:gliding motility-associated-like protein